MVSLAENAKKILLALGAAGGRRSVRDIAAATGLDIAAVTRGSLSLSERGLVAIEARRRPVARLTPEGESYARDGLPERRLLADLAKAGGRIRARDVPSVTSVQGSMVPVALGWLRKKNWARIRKEGGDSILEVERSPPAEGPDEELIRFLGERKSAYVDELGALSGALEVLAKRNLATVTEEAERDLVLTDSGRNALSGGIVLEEGVSSLTHNMLATGAWRKAKLRRYDIQASVAPTWPGKKQPYLRFLDDLKERLVGLGFKEMRGPIVELAFYNCDALYMPQDHPAREIHDVYYVKEPRAGEIGMPDVLDRVRRTHENGWRTGSKGWRYAYSLSEAKRLLLRSHTTAVSARMLLSERLEIPGKYYSIARCFRPDVVDRTHLTEFNQVEGIILGEGLSLQDLLGVLATFAVEIAGATKLRFVPDYFPFTEPSIELNAYKEGYGWVEFGGSGIFRPELTKPLGIDVPVLAWGLGADRLYMMKAKIDDIRALFTQDLDYLRGKELV
ncbi:MAG: phenylalanine--tRNA ligase subunit alpha [Candidatus Brockarchaeota archaeon]|nr:phenylalanine--tRNA ligase subunit alpha [Candidatus Brockarchaeota archaeon]